MKRARKLSSIRAKERSSTGAGGRLVSHGSTLSSYIVRNIEILQKMSQVKEDPREALLKHSKATEKDPYWIAPDYKKIQHQPIFQPVSDDKDKDKEDEELFTIPWKKHLFKIFNETLKKPNFKINHILSIYGLFLGGPRRSPGLRSSIQQKDLGFNKAKREKIIEKFLFFFIAKIINILSSILKIKYGIPRCCPKIRLFSLTERLALKL
ncbi:gastrulation defective 1 -like protein [Brachionus plicatilis]|uniref:Gastrulation defective 1-like protein n=1 Tax=Brachionus plicatilis TaxID=10195 RepID=A0A3M7RMI3_BRAPC|nr:gastrulation defective 1 -like protein [Brachionus plicatilis]